MSGKHRAQSEEKDKETTSSSAFWSTTSEEAESYKKRVAEQISRLQQRQLDLVKETADELEVLKKELAENNALDNKIAAAQKPLLEEIEHWKKATEQAEQHKIELEAHLQEVQKSYQAQYLQLQGLVSSLKNTVRGQAHTLDQQLRVFSLDATQSLESLLSSLEHSQLPTLETPQFTPRTAPLPPHKASQETVTPRPAPKPVTHSVTTSKVHSKRVSPRKLTVRTVLVALVVTGIAGLVRVVLHRSPTHTQASVSSASGQVAGVSTDPTITDATADEDYPESFATVPFNKTVWDTFTENDMGVTVTYPKNASNKVIELSGDHLWILRRWGYLLKITRDSGYTSLDTWMATNQNNFSDYSSVKSTFKGIPAYLLTPVQKSDTSGTIYAIQHGQDILEFWIKDEDPKTDDGQRLAVMIERLKILPAS